MRAREVLPEGAGPARCEGGLRWCLALGLCPYDAYKCYPLPLPLPSFIYRACAAAWP